MSQCSSWQDGAAMEIEWIYKLSEEVKIFLAHSEPLCDEVKTHWDVFAWNYLNFPPKLDERMG